MYQIDLDNRVFGSTATRVVEAPAIAEKRAVAVESRWHKGNEPNRSFEAPGGVMRRQG